MRLYMDAYDAQGSFLSNLTKTDLQILENGETPEPVSLNLIQNGVQVIIALNTSPSMATQTAGVSGFQAIQNTLIDWASQQPEATLDDVSLSTPTGLFLIRERDPEKVLEAFSNYQPDLLKNQPGLSSLAEALDMATDPLDRPLMKRSILFISPALPNSDNTTIEDLASRAKSIGVRVHVWLIVQAGSPPAANPLQKLAEATSGQFHEVALSDPLPQIEPLLAPLRQSYEIHYTSSIQKSGSQRVSVEINQAQQAIRSNTVRFPLQVEPPNPIFLSPPATIQRVWSGMTKTAESALTPEEVPLEVLIEFPDQHNRALKATRLYVDDTLIAENTSEPFNKFSWSLADLTTPGRHTLRVEAVDILDLSGSSSEIPVEVLVEQPAQTNLSSRISSSGMIALGAVGAAGMVLALVLIFSGSKRRIGRKHKQLDKKLQQDPVTQPVKIIQEPARTKKDKGSHGTHGWSGWPHLTAAEAPARMVCLDENEEPITGRAFSLTRQEITFGTDPRRATQVLDSPTVDGLHARLYREPNGHFYLADQGSIAGTWINFAPITNSGARLEHGDLIHIGKVLFRFELAAPERLPIVEIQVLDSEQ
jgi:hypothetical protein